MKAWRTYSRDGVYATIVFAETAGKAKSIAMRTDCCEDMEFTEIRVERDKEADAYYRGADEIDWYNDNDRKLLIKRCYGWEMEDGWECDECLWKDECEHYVEPECEEDNECF